MDIKILYYIPIKGIQNKARTATLTIDWYKKKFRMPLDETIFEQLSTEDWVVDVIPVIGWTINIENPIDDIQGKVESIIYDKGMEYEYLMVLIRPFK